jgi:hypothetical protein
MAIMARDQFWAIVERARAGVDTRTGDGAAEVAERIGSHLAELGRDAAVAFDLRYSLLGTESYDWALWGAAYVMKGGCSDDAFDYFRAWLVTQGRDAWERALRDPDTLAELGVDPDDDFLECEDLLSVGAAALLSTPGRDLLNSQRRLFGEVAHHGLHGERVPAASVRSGCGRQASISVPVPSVT